MKSIHSTLTTVTVCLLPKGVQRTTRQHALGELRPCRRTVKKGVDTSRIHTATLHWKNRKQRRLTVTPSAYSVRSPAHILRSRFPTWSMANWLVFGYPLHAHLGDDFVANTTPANDFISDGSWIGTQILKRGPWRIPKKFCFDHFDPCETRKSSSDAKESPEIGKSYQMNV